MDFNENINYDDIFKYIFLVENLFSFITNNKSNVIQINAILSDDKKVNICLPKLCSNNTYDRKIHNTLFRLDFIPNLEKVIENWFEKYKIFKPLYNLYFSSINTNMYVELQLITFTQALESYHRRLDNSNYMPKNEFEPIKKKIISCIKNNDELDKGMLDKLSSSIEYGYEYSLRKRLNLILKGFDEDLLRVILGNFETIPIKKLNQNFVNKVVDNRNYYTHYDEDITHLSIEKLVYLNNQLKILIEFCFLKELGFSNSEMIEIINENKQRFKVSPIYS